MKAIVRLGRNRRDRGAARRRRQRRSLTERCLLCHGAALIAQQRKDAAAWGRTVTQMRTWGTQIQDEDQAALVAYLAQHFGPGVRQQP